MRPFFQFPYLGWVVFMGLMVPVVCWGEEQALDTKKEWETGALLSLYLPKDESAFLLPIVTADRGAWHLEGRYNYEDLDTTSLWTGWTISGGKTVEIEATPLVGVVFGETSGVAPGLELTAVWKKWEFYTEAEYLFDAEDEDDNFFYNWSELSYYLKEGFRVGIVGQRTRAVETELELERGPLIGYEKGSFNFTAYIFNVGRNDAYPVIAVGADF